MNEKLPITILLASEIRTPRNNTFFKIKFNTHTQGTVNNKLLKFRAIRKTRS
jgi:hypothetical protein